MNALPRLRFLPPQPGDDPIEAGAGALMLYEAACVAVAEARTAGEAKAIVDKTEALRVYARQANNRRLELDAAEIRIRAERRLGEIIAAQKETVGLNGGRAGAGRPKLGPASQEGPKDNRPTLAEVGVDYKLSSRAQRLAALPPERFGSMLSGWRSRAERDGERVTVDLMRGDDKKARRAEREQQWAGKVLAMPDKHFGLVLADPEWKWLPRSEETGADRGAENHYQTSPTEVIKARDVPAIAAPDSVLALWATVPMLLDALAVMEAWGYAYKSHLVWRKIYPGKRMGMGFWARIDHELLLIGTRGRIVAPALGEQWPCSVVDADWTGEHSEKPAIFYEILERYFPTVPKIELNARRRRPGWDAWGFDAPQLPAEGGRNGHQEQSR